MLDSVKEQVNTVMNVFILHHFRDVLCAISDDLRHTIHEIDAMREMLALLAKDDELAVQHLGAAMSIQSSNEGLEN